MENIKKIENILLEYNNRTNMKLEKYLFNLIDTSNLEDNQFGDTENIGNIERFNKINFFIKSLNNEQIESNCILKITKIFLDTSIIDCKNILKKLYIELDKMNQLIKFLNTSSNINLSDIKLQNIELFSKYQLINISCIGIIKNYLPNVIEEINILNLLKYEKVIIDIEKLKNRNELVRRYNNYVKLIINIANDIYKLKLCNILINNNKNIYDFSFNISFCDPLHKLETQFIIAQQKTKLLKLNLK